MAVDKKSNRTRWKELALNHFIFCIMLLWILAGCAGDPGPQSLRRGMRALERNRYAESISWFQRSLRSISTDDERAIIFNGLGIAYYKLGQEKNAFQAFEAAMAANPAAVEPVYNMGFVALETGNDDKAMACFEKAALLNEQDPRPLEFLAIIYSRRRQWDDARRVLNEAARQTHHSPRILNALAVTELKASNVNQALSLLQEALEQDAHYAPAIYNLAVINQQWLQKRDQALPLFAEYARLVSSGPQADQARSIIKEINHTAAPLAAATNLADQPPSPAVKSLSTAETALVSAGQTQQVAAVPPAPFPSFEELMQVAGKLEQQGRREAAFNNYLRIARAAEKAGKIPVRDRAIRHAVSLADGNPQAAYDLGVYFMEKGRKDEALLYFKAAVAQDANLRPASLALARVAIEKGEYDTAIVSLKKADQVKPADPEALWLLAELYDRYLCLSNSAASVYAQFTERFPNDRRTPVAMNRLKTFNSGIKSSGEVLPGKSKSSQSFWQRFFKLSSGSTNEAFNKKSAETGHQ